MGQDTAELEIYIDPDTGELYTYSSASGEFAHILLDWIMEGNKSNEQIASFTKNVVPKLKKVGTLDLENFAKK
jgi:hypothetical protein